MIILPMPIYTPSTPSSGCGSYVSDYKSDIAMCITTVLLDIVVAGLFFGVGYFVYYLAKEHEPIGASLLGIVDLLVLALAVLLFEETSECFKWTKESIKEHKENKAIKKRINKNKQLNSSENYGDFVTPYYSARNNYYGSKSGSVDCYVMSLFKKEKQNERK